MIIEPNISIESSGIELKKKTGEGGGKEINSGQKITKPIIN